MAYGQETLLAYFRKHNENFDKRVGVNRKRTSAHSYWYAMEYTEQFLHAEYKLSDIPFTALNRSFIEKFDLYLRITHTLAPGSIKLITIRLNSIVGNAIAEGIITADPFAGYESESPQSTRKYLTKIELERLMTTPLACPKHYLVRDLFLFSCYTGISYVDMCALTEDHIEVAEDGEVWIKAKREKTGVGYEIMFLDLPKQILERYRNTASKGHLFPMYCSSEINLQLKEIARICGISQHLTFQSARHNFGTHVTLSQGVPIETVSRMMGHKSISTTQIYAKVTDKKVDEDMKRLKARTAGTHITLYEDETLRAAIRYPVAK